MPTPDLEAFIEKARRSWTANSDRAVTDADVARFREKVAEQEKRHGTLQASDLESIWVATMREGWRLPIP